MKIDFTKGSLQDWDGPRRVMGEGLVGASVDITHPDVSLPGYVEVLEVTPEGLQVHHEDSNTVTFVPFNKDMELTYL